MTLIILGSLIGSALMAAAILCALGIGVWRERNPFRIPITERRKPCYDLSRTLLRKTLRRIHP